MSKYQVMRQKGMKEKRRNNVFFLCAIILLTLLIVIGGSYAFLSLTLFSEKKVEVTTGVLATSFKDGNTITLENAYPMTDSRGMATSPYEFEIENTGDIEAKYDIILEEDKNTSNLNHQYIKYSLKGKDGKWSEPSSLTSFVLEKGIQINPSEKNIYALRLWIDEKVGNEAQGKEFRARIVIYTVQSNGTTEDITPPMIHLAGNLSMNVEENSSFTDPGVERVTDDKDALDKNEVKVSYEYYDGETTKEVESIDTSKRGVYYIYYRISDQNGNEGVSVRSINVYKKDTEPPVIRLKGEALIGIEKEEDYIELGAEAEKNGEDLTSRIVVVGTVNTKRIGTYPIKYLITDSNGNTSSIVRIVNVLSMSLDKEEIILDLSNKPTERIGFSGENLGELTYTSNDESIATVDNKGNVTGKKLGETTVTITSTTGLHKTVKVKVQKTIEITYVKQGTGVNSIGKEKDHCVITSGDSCNVVAPSITVGSGYTAVGWSTSNTATTGIAAGANISLSGNATYYSISYKNAITYTVHFNANGNTVSATSKSCTIPAVYNSNTQATNCSITTPTITAPSATPTVVGFNQSASATSSQVGSNATLSVTSSINGKTYYAITRKDAKTVTITFNKNGASTQTNSSGTASTATTVTRACTIAATYNGTAQATTCNVTSPTIVGSTNTPTVVGYSTATGTHTSNWNQNTAKAVSAKATYYAQTTKAAKTITITFNRNGAASQTDANGTASTATTVTRSCTIAATYNGTAQATTCSVTSPKIVASSNTPTITGYSTAAGTHSNSWSHSTAKAVSANATYYAQTTKAAVTRSITYSKQGTGVSAIGKTSDSCSIAATYNGTAQGTSCNVTSPSITVVSGYTAVGWSTSSSATTGTGVGKTITLSGNATYYSISYKNAVSRTVYFNANKNTINATSKSCTIPASYNSNAQATSCNITTPTITAPTATPTVIGFNQSASATSSQVGSNATLSVTSSISGKTYYAITRKNAVTRTVTYTKSTGVSAVGKTSDSCTIAATYNGTTQGTTCNVTLPSITVSSGYTAGFWSTSNTATSGTAAGTSVSLSSNRTYYARANVDKPKWSLASIKPESDCLLSPPTGPPIPPPPPCRISAYIKGSGAGTLTDKLQNATLKVGSASVSMVSPGGGTPVTSHYLFGFPIAATGAVVIVVPAGTLCNNLGACNDETAITTGITLYQG